MKHRLRNDVIEKDPHCKYKEPMGENAAQCAPIRISIVEDDAEIRSHLVTLISGTSGFRLISEHSCAEEAIRAIPLSRPDIVLMDINLPGMSGIECVRSLKKSIAEVQVLMLTVYEDTESIFESLKAGASGYLLKRLPGQKLIEAVRDAHNGGAPMSGQIARKVVQFFNQQERREAKLQDLSIREREVLKELAEGRPYKEIADVLNVSIDTVRKHLQSVYQKLHVHNRTEAVVKYLQKR
jgi:DNA-binding NarL/FixJ family response regulator